MPSPDLNNFEMEIQMQQNLRQKMTQIDSARDEFLRDVDKIRTEDECLRDFKALLEDLTTEKLALVNELRHINTDINLLEQAINQAEQSRQKSIDNAHKVYVSEMIPLRGQINEIRDAMGKERLPSNLVDSRDLEEVFPTDHKANGVAEVPFEQPNLATIWPLAMASVAQNPYGSPFEALRQASMLNFMAAVSNRLQQSTMPMEEPSGDGGADSGVMPEQPPSAPVSESVISQVGGGASFGHLDVGTGLSSLSKQQQPPMKTCASCQQQIHRNAPICPLCKSKSRSRHPKKKQRPSKSDEQQQE